MPSGPRSPDRLTGTAHIESTGAGGQVELIHATAGMPPRHSLAWLLRGSRGGSGSGVEDGAETIHQVLRAEGQQDEQLERFHQRLHPFCIYCALMLNETARHCHRRPPLHAQ